MELYMNPLSRTYYQNLKKVAEGGTPTSEANYFMKALTAGGSATGAEFVPTVTSAEIITVIREKNWARQAFDTIMCPTPTFNIPKISSGVTVYGIASELTSTTAITSSTPGTATVALTQVTLAVNVMISNKLKGYSVAPIIPLIKDDIASAVAAAEEDLFVNGDTTSTTSYADNINGAYNASTNIAGVDATHNTHKLLFSTSLRKAAGDSTSGAGAVISQDMVLQSFAKMGVYGRNHNEMIILISPDSEADALQWPSIVTLEKYGPQATIFTGEIGKVYGASVIVSDKLPNTASSSLVDNTGVRGASGNSFTMALVIWKKSPVLGIPQVSERQFTLKIKEEPEFDRFLLVGVEDIALNLRHTSGVHKLYNLA